MTDQAPRVSAETLGDVVTDDHVITLVLSTVEHSMIVDALDKEIRSLNQSGAYKHVAAYRLLRDEISDVQPREGCAPSETDDVTRHVTIA